MKNKVLVAVDENGKAMGNWDGRFVTRDTIHLVTERDALIELAHYRARFLYRYPENWKVVMASVGFSWDNLIIEQRAQSNPLRKKKRVTVGSRSDSNYE